jgi:ATP adenylyltransferase
MKKLWAPWRIDYILSEKPPGCIFCDKPAESWDEDNYILYRGKYNFIILNAFPYNNGHMMVIPYRHTATLSGWGAEEQQEMMELADLCVELLGKAMHPDGFNLGINMGLVGGAGVADHIHMHIVPRWNGDTNFMPVISDTRVISEALQATYKKLKEVLDGLSKN